MTDDSIAYRIAFAYACGRFDQPVAKPYVPSVEFAERAVAEHKAIGELTELYNEMLAELAVAS